MTFLYHAETLTNRKRFIDLGEFLSKERTAIGVAWRRALTMQSVRDPGEFPDLLCFWKDGYEPPKWWQRIIEIVDAEKELSQLRAFVAKPKIEEGERLIAKKQMAELEKKITRLKKERKQLKSNKNVVVIDIKRVGKKCVCNGCGVHQVYSTDNTVCYECKMPL